MKETAVVAGASAKKARVSGARAAAFHILLELGRSMSAHSDDLLQSLAVDALPAQDRNLCMALTMGVLRWQLSLDALIAPLLTHKTKLDEPVCVALRMGAFQLLKMDRIPAHAAISDSVELTKRAGHRFASGLVNAVLRKVASGGRPEMEAATAHPEWMVARWREFYGGETAEAICAWDQEQPAATLRVSTAEAEAELLARGVQLAPGNFLAKARRVLSGEAGLALRLQDEGSQLVAELLGSRSDVSGRQVASILDCCAAPGGKTAILAERFAGSRVVACDVSAVRVERMREFFNTTPWTTRIECRVADALELSDAERFDLVLCDVPCSGTGTLARNPEIKLRLQAEDLQRQQERQVAILRAALGAVAEGGELVYSTCSLEPEEGELVVARVLGEVSGFKIVPVGERLAELRERGTMAGDLLLRLGVRRDFLRTMPGVVRSDGFFAAVIERV